jgi:hypothetical protein
MEIGANATKPGANLNALANALQSPYSALAATGPGVPVD